MITTINPSTNETLATYTYMDDQAVETVLATGHEAYTSHWRDASFEERAKVALAFAQTLEAHAQELATLMCDEMGKCHSEGLAEVTKSVAVLKAVAHRADQYFTIGKGADLELDHDGLDVCIDIRPIGAVLAIMPWNFPVWQIMRVLAPNMIGGNTVLLKHAPAVTGSALRLQELWLESVAPAGVFQTLVIDHDQTAAIMADDRIQGVTLTGSPRAGRHVASVAASHGKKSVLELGGSDPFLICADADLDEAVATLVTARYSNCGQICTAAKRAIVHESVHDQAVEKLTQAVAALRIGDPHDPQTQIGPMVSIAQRDAVLEQIQRGIEAGATLICGGEAIDQPGAWITPGLLTDVTPENPLAQEEVFGPILVVMRAKSDEDMITLANATPYGLGATVYSGDTDHGLSLARQIDSGMVAINAQNLSHPIVPFGGTKASGYGRELGPWGAIEFMNIRTVSVRR